MKCIVSETKYTTIYMYWSVLFCQQLFIYIVDSAVHCIFTIHSVCYCLDYFFFLYIRNVLRVSVRYEYCFFFFCNYVKCVRWWSWSFMLFHHCSHRYGVQSNFYIICCICRWTLNCYRHTHIRIHIRIVEKLKEKESCNYAVNVSVGGGPRQLSQSILGTGF